MKKLLFLTIVLLGVVASIYYENEQPKSSAFSLKNENDRVKELPGYGAVSGVQMAGYLSVRHSTDPYKDDENLFYWFVSSQRDISQDPIVLWLNGGPGSSGFHGFFAENGPYIVQKDLTLQERPYPWSKKLSYLMIEQAPGIGLAYAKPGIHLVDEAQAMDLLFHAIQEFFVRYPELANHPFYIAGQSYAGKYLPQLATRILANKPSINLKGILVGDGWVNPIIQQASNADYAYSHGLIDLASYNEVKKLYEDCAKEIKLNTPSSREANKVCMKIQKLIREKSGVAAVNIRAEGELDFSPIISYLNRKDVREALHVDPRVEGTVLYSERVAEDLEIGEHDSAAHLYPPLMKAGIKVLFYSGLEDGTDSNFMGTDKWISELDWSGKEMFNKAPACIWKNKNGEVAGYYKQADGLFRVKIRGAGHLAPMDQPANLQDMLERFVFEEKFCDEANKAQ